MADREEFLHLSLKSVTELYPSNVLDASAEAVFKPLIKWVEVNVEERREVMNATRM